MSIPTAELGSQPIATASSSSSRSSGSRARTSTDTLFDKKIKLQKLQKIKQQEKAEQAKSHSQQDSVLSQVSAAHSNTSVTPRVRHVEDSFRKDPPPDDDYVIIEYDGLE